MTLPFLDVGDGEEIIAFFRRHMTMPQRRLLMAERPLLYARMFPATARVSIVNQVRFELDQQDHNEGAPE
jgi:hypothetical protein